MSNKNGFWYNNKRVNNYLRKQKLNEIEKETNLFNDFINSGKSLVKKLYSNDTNNFFVCLFIKDNLDGYEFVMTPVNSYKQNTFEERLKTWTYIDGWETHKDNLEYIQEVLYQFNNRHSMKQNSIKARHMINKNKDFKPKDLRIKKRLFNKN